MSNSKGQKIELTKAKLSAIKQLLQKKYREEEGKFLLEGWKTVEEALNANVEIDTVVYDEQKVPNKQIIPRLHKASKEMFTAKAKEIDALSDAVTSQGIIAVLPKLSAMHRLAEIMKSQSAVVVAVESINDPGNLGTIIRTCDWFGADALVISKNSVELYNPKVVRATMGSLFHLPIIDDTDLIAFLKKCRNEGFAIYSTALANSDDIRKVVWDKKSVVVIGSESHGVSSEIIQLADHRIMIPKYGKAESLNAAMACGIVLSQIKLRQ
ncbi:MAG: RNA methyltransferase [Bacteroidota bacterium]|nr:RNA methyltransferase [Bacteroidota bacterium]